MERLFALPQFDKAFADFVHKAIHELSIAEQESGRVVILNVLILG